MTKMTKIQDKTRLGDLTQGYENVTVLEREELDEGVIASMRLHRPDSRACAAIAAEGAEFLVALALDDDALASLYSVEDFRLTRLVQESGRLDGLLKEVRDVYEEIAERFQHESVKLIAARVLREAVWDHIEAQRPNGRG